MWYQGLTAEPTTSTRLHTTQLRFVETDSLAYTHDGEVYRPIVLLTRARLPCTSPFRIWLHGQPVFVQAVPTDQTIEVDATRLEQLFGYTLRSFRAVTNRVFASTASRLTYFLAPVDDNGELDWMDVKTAAADKEIPLDPTNLDDLPADSIIGALGD